MVRRSGTQCFARRTQGSGCDISESLGFDPLREIFYCDCSILVVSWRCGQRPYYVDAPSSKGPHRRYEMDFIQGETCYSERASSSWGMCGQLCVRPPPPMANKNLREKLFQPRPLCRCAKSTCPCGSPVAAKSFGYEVNWELLQCPFGHPLFHRCCTHRRAPSCDV